jgi:hypothetical protein
LTELELHGVAAPAPKNDVDLQHRFWFYFKMLY